MLNAARADAHAVYLIILRQQIRKKNLKRANFYFGNDMFVEKSNEVESRYLQEKVTSLQVESSL